MDQTVELYCGAEKPFSRIAEALGYATFTVDVNPEYQPNLVGAVSESLAKEIPASPLIVWAAPPFDDVFRSRECWEPDGSLYPLTDRAMKAMDAFRGVVGLIYALNPTWWFIEQPKSLVRTMPLFAGFNRGHPSRNRHTIRHDEFGGNSATESDIWTNAYWWIPRPGERDGRGGAETGQRVPSFAIAQMFEQLERYRQTGSYRPTA